MKIMKNKLMNAYKVFSFKNKNGDIFLVLDAIVPDDTKNNVHLQGFVSNGGCYPFPLYFSENFQKENLLSEALEDGAAYVKNIEQWKSEKLETTLAELSDYPYFIQFIRDNCKSDELLNDIKELFYKNNMA